MKLKGICRKYTDRNATAFITEPPLTPQIIEEVKRRVWKPAFGEHRTPRFQAISPELVAGRLVIRSPLTGDLHRLLSDLEELLTQAEDVVSARKNQSQKQAAIDQNEQQNAVKSASEGFGLPIVDDCC
jgi:hypothetical protein